MASFSRKSTEALEPFEALLSVLPSAARPSGVKCIFKNTGEKSGRGLYASKPFEKGEIVIQIPVEYTITATMFERLLRRKQEEASQTFDISFDTEDMLKKEVMLLLYGSCGIMGQGTQANTVDNTFAIQIMS